jgi:putative nucleotidyltransferase with HDIG domain
MITAKSTSIKKHAPLIDSLQKLLVHDRTDPSMFRKVCKDVQDLGGYRLVWIGLANSLNGSTGAVAPIAFYYPGDGGNKYAEELIQISMETKGLLSGSFSPKRNRVFGDDYIKDNFPPPFIDLLDKKGIGSVAVIPLKYDKSTVGLINIYSPDKFISRDEIDVLKEVARNIAADIRSLKLEIELDDTSKQLRKALYETIDAITLMSEIKDPYTSGHQKKVALLASAISEELGLPRDIIDGIYVSGLLHDVGKISVPNDILSKPGQLNEGEFIIVKNHPVISYDILKNIEFPWSIADIVSQHHEKMDGSGYPSGIKGRNIRVEARILAVADVVEAMTAHRPYRPALGIKKAIDEITNNKSRLYDGRIVEACLAVLEKKKIEL